jgi:ketosteroid isomerase-like protein
VDRFLAALTAGDLQALMGVLAPDVVAVAARIDHGGEFDTAITFVVEGDRITRMYAMRNPNKLGRLDEVAGLQR